MTLLEILKYPHDVLKKKAENITIINNDIISIINNMIETMLFNNGIGLAAPQVNIKKNIIVININIKTSSLTILNPKILYKNGIVNNLEGCLSFPNIFIKVKRSFFIKIKFININGEKRFLYANNLLSVCIQHEIDHLHGITLYDKMSNLKKKIIKI